MAPFSVLSTNSRLPGIRSSPESRDPFRYAYFRSIPRIIMWCRAPWSACAGLTRHCPNLSKCLLLINNETTSPSPKDPPRGSVSAYVTLEKNIPTTRQVLGLFGAAQPYSLVLERLRSVFIAWPTTKISRSPEASWQVAEATDCRTPADWRGSCILQPKSGD